MLFSISILGFNRADCTKKCLQSIEKHTKGVEFEVIFVNNGSSDDSENVFLRSKIENKFYVPLGVNTGFPRGHNLSLNYASGDYFVVLNNDLVIEEDNWLEKLAKPLINNEKVALVGIDGIPNSLRNDGNGFFGEKLEYIDGSCLMGKTDFFLDFGLFNPSYDMFFYEDSDLSLRVRQAGYKIATVKLKHTHTRSSSFSGINNDFKTKILNKNKEVFMKRWSGYLQHRRFNNSILVKMFSHGGGDLICMTPVLEGLRRDHPHAKIELETNWPDLFKHNVSVDEIHGVRRQYTHAYDRIIELNLDYSSYDLIVESAARIAATDLHEEEKTPSLYLDPLELQNGSDVIRQIKEDENDVVIGCALQMDRYNWHGRNWSFENTQILIAMLIESGYKVVELGKNVKSTGLASLDLVGKTELRELISIVANLDCFVGVDSMIFHIAQAFELPSYVLFGATEPISRIVNFDKTVSIRNEHLPCLGCYQRKGKSDYNKCILGTEACMQELSPETVYKHILGEIDGMASNINYLQKRARRQR